MFSGMKSIKTPVHNVRGFRRSAAIREYFICKYLNVTVNGHVHSYSQSMTSCVTKMAISQRSVCCSLKLHRIWTHAAAGRVYRRTRSCAVDGRPFQYLSLLQLQMDLLCCFFHGCNTGLSPMKGVHTSS